VTIIAAIIISILFLIILTFTLSGSFEGAGGSGDVR
jgi:hypothetical protein